jgi:hypothetical protein
MDSIDFLTYVTRCPEEEHLRKAHDVYVKNHTHPLSEKSEMHNGGENYIKVFRLACENTFVC